MIKKVTKSKAETGHIAKNRKAYFDYRVLEEYEAGIVLQGSEVKSLRLNSCNFADSHAFVRSENNSEEVWLQNLSIPEYKNARNYTHTPARERKLLLHKREIKKMLGSLKQKGLTLIPLSLYFNKKGLVKIKLGLCKGKNQGDKRETIKQREWQRNKSRILKNQD